MAHSRLPRDYSHELTKKFRALALRHALSAKANAGEIIVIDALTLKDPKTGGAAEAARQAEAREGAHHRRRRSRRQCRPRRPQIPHVDVLPNAGLNVYDILRCRKLVLTQDAVECDPRALQG